MAVVSRYLAVNVAGQHWVVERGPDAGTGEHVGPARAIVRAESAGMALAVTRAMNLVESAGGHVAEIASEALRQVLVDHQRATDSSCSCGTPRVGDSFAEHIVVEWRDLLLAR